MISITEWQVGGIDDNIFKTSFNNVFNYEVNNSKNVVEAEYNAKIGLMYITDYVYASPPEDWNTTVFDYGYVDGSDPNNNWMYMGLYEWTISRDFGSSSNQAYLISKNGDLNSDGGVDQIFAIRPSFYLDSDVLYIGGTGSSSDPFRIQ